ncbi:integrase core domain-containing protein [Paraburkholderia adhaesiva]|uniref:integrase core domain-containing protein n=1 Tax=Paraburkholderia adhaesiva TaxID=2883244 RepID=UPI003571775A
MSFARSGKPVVNASIASFIGRFRDECLSGHRFAPMRHGRRLIERHGAAMFF